MSEILGGYEVLTYPPWAQAPLRHGFTTHCGEAATGQSGGGDFDALARAAGFADLRILDQRHGIEVVRAEQVPSGVPADAVITDRPGILLGVQTADCVPVLLFDPRVPAVGAVHAGWRGTAAGVAAAAVRALGASYACEPRDLWAVLGPAIGPCCYEVGPEVREALERAAPGAGVSAGRGPRGGATVDLWRANRLLLEAAGLAPARIGLVGLCTSCRGELFPSFRRDGPGCGRMLSFIGLPL